MDSTQFGGRVFPLIRPHIVRLRPLEVPLRGSVYLIALTSFSLEEELPGLTTSLRSTP